MFDRIDPHPERRRAQIAWARAVLRGCPDPEPLRRACAVLLTLSDDPYDRTLAAELLRSAEQRPSYPSGTSGRPCAGERSDAQAESGTGIAARHLDDPLSRLSAAVGSR